MAKAVSAQSDTALTSPISQIFPFQKEKEAAKIRSLFQRKTGIRTLGTRQKERRTTQKRPQVVDLQPLSAERQGFEPWVPVRVQRFSRPSRSTAPASFLWSTRPAGPGPLYAEDNPPGVGKKRLAALFCCASGAYVQPAACCSVKSNPSQLNLRAIAAETGRN